ncbi:hypothetical protein JTE90_023038 [Oedothorax gibbosus]|uniref:Uncharacterized protein n=1 Tax=Oedothorax gibbosus TaxID=931172 RepID=A0AAV6V337_9ARAC|nr:hypothetical protein JTE90_023038 [Oedothorax gibbosus]
MPLIPLGAIDVALEVAFVCILKIIQTLVAMFNYVYGGELMLFPDGWSIRRSARRRQIDEARQDEEPGAARGVDEPDEVADTEGVDEEDEGFVSATEGD